MFSFFPLPQRVAFYTASQCRSYTWRIAAVKVTAGTLLAGTWGPRWCPDHKGPIESHGASRVCALAQKFGGM